MRLVEASMAENDRVYQIGEMAELTGLSHRTLRYYEELGLLEPRSHGPGRFRVYTEADLERINRIKRIKEHLGFSLYRAKELLDRDDQRKGLMERAKTEKSRAARREALEGAREILLDELALLKEREQKLKEMERLLNKRLQEVDGELAGL